MAEPPRIPHLVASISPQEFRGLMWKLAAIPNGARIAASTALNKVAAKGRTRVAALVAEAMGARLTSVNRRIWTKKATRNRLFAQIVLSVVGVSLIGFIKRPQEGGKSPEATVLGATKKYPHAFIARGVMGGKSTAGQAILVGGGGLQVFERQGAARVMRAGRYKGRKRQPIVALKGPSAGETFLATPGLAETAEAEMDMDMTRTLDSQVDWLLKRSQQEVVSEAA